MRSPDLGLLPPLLLLLLASLPAAPAVREPLTAFGLEDPAWVQLEPQHALQPRASVGAAARRCAGCGGSGNLTPAGSPLSVPGSPLLPTYPPPHPSPSAEAAAPRRGGPGRGGCDTSGWPDVDHNLTCGPCKVLVDRFSDGYLTCEGYCAAVGRQCTGAWEERHDTCNIAFSMECDTAYTSNNAICECGGEEVTGRRQVRVVAIESLGVPHGYLKVERGGVIVRLPSRYPPGMWSLFSLSEVAEEDAVTVSLLGQEQSYLGGALGQQSTQLRSEGASDAAAGAGAAAPPRFRLHKVPQKASAGLEVVRFESLDHPGHFVGVERAQRTQQRRESAGKNVLVVNISEQDMKKTRLFDFRLHPSTWMMSRAWHFDHIVYNITKGPGGDLLRFEELLHDGSKLQGLLHPAGGARFEGNLSTEDGAKVTAVLLSPAEMSGQVVARFRQLGPAEEPAWEEVTITVEPRQWQCSKDSFCMQNLLLGFIAFSLVCCATLLSWWSHAAVLCSALVMFLWFVCADSALLYTAVQFWWEWRWVAVGWHWWQRGGGSSVPLSPMYWVDAVLLFFVVVGCLEVFLLSVVTKRRRGGGGQAGGLSSTGAAAEGGREALEPPEGAEAGAEVFCESIYSNLSVGMTRSCLVFFAQGILFGMYVHSVIVTVGETLPHPSEMRKETEKPEWSEVKEESYLALLACVIVQMSLEKLLGGHFGLQFTNVWSRLLRAKSFRAVGTEASEGGAGGSGQGFGGHFWKQLAVASGYSHLLGLDGPNSAKKDGEEEGQVAASADSAATAAAPASPSSIATPGALPDGRSERISKLEVYLRMCMAFAAQSVERRFIMYTLPIMVCATARDPSNFVKDILAYAYITSLDVAANEEPRTAQLDPPQAAPPAGPSSAPGPPPGAQGGDGARGEGAEAHAGGALLERPRDEARG